MIAHFYYLPPNYKVHVEFDVYSDSSTEFASKINDKVMTCSASSSSPSPCVGTDVPGNTRSVMIVGGSKSADIYIGNVKIFVYPCLPGCEWCNDGTDKSCYLWVLLA